jgi:predicted ATPase
MEILKGRIAQFKSAMDLHDPFVFFDRGLPDVLAYMNYFGQPVEAEFTMPSLELRYDMVILLPPWEEIYRRDAERLESFQQACEIHRFLEDTYVDCGYNALALDPGPVPDRVDQLIGIIEKNYG